MRDFLLLVLSDSHCGHRRGLTPPSYQSAVPETAPRERHKDAEWARLSWEWFRGELRRLPRPDLLLFNGDAVEGKGVRSGGTELITADREEQVEMALAVIEEVRAQRVTMTFGTAAHVGEDEDWESILARRYGAEKIEAEAHLDIRGLQICARHHIGGGSAPAGRATQMVNAQIKQLLWTAHEQQPRANLILRAHIHRCYSFGEPGLNFAGWVGPGLQGLGTKYGARRVDGLPVHFGFLAVRVGSATDWGVSAVLAPMAMQAAQVARID